MLVLVYQIREVENDTLSALTIDLTRRSSLISKVHETTFTRGCPTPNFGEIHLQKKKTQQKYLLDFLFNLNGGEISENL